MKSYEFGRYRIVQGDGEWMAYYGGDLIAKAETSDELENLLT